MKEILGTIKRVTVPRCSKAGLTQMKDLQVFGASLKEKEIVAMPNLEHNLEGPYWLAKVMGPAKIATRAMVHAAESFEVGWLVVQVTWYHYEEVHNRTKPATRAYRLKSEKKWVVVNSLLFIKGLHFEKDPQGRALRSGSTDLNHFSMDGHNTVMNCMGASDFGAA
jgi:hypothetical protein